MALTVIGEELFAFAIGALPSWVRQHDEFLTASANVMTAARVQADYLFGQTLITTAQGATPTTPDWLNQHARDRDTSRQAGETDVVLQERLRIVPDALTRGVILAAANAVLTAAGVAGTAAMLELPRDGAWAGTYAAMTGMGGTFVQVGTVSKFTPAVLPWPTTPFRAASVFPPLAFQLIISGAASAGNNGTRTITGIEGNAALVSNGAGVAGVDPTAAWSVRRLDVTGNVTDGFARAYAGRGWRSAGNRSGIIVILPFGTSVGTASAVEESIRGKKAAGFRLIVERRAVP